MKEQLLMKLIDRLLDDKLVTSEVNHPAIGKKCIIRTYSAGVHYGEVIDVNGYEVELKNSRRIWKWTEGFTLSECSQNGIGSSSRVACNVPVIYLTQAIEIIPCSEKAQKSIEACHEND